MEDVPQSELLRLPLAHGDNEATPDTLLLPLVQSDCVGVAVLVPHNEAIELAVANAVTLPQLLALNDDVSLV